MTVAHVSSVERLSSRDINSPQYTSQNFSSGASPVGDLVAVFGVHVTLYQRLLHQIVAPAFLRHDVSEVFLDV